VACASQALVDHVLGVDAACGQKSGILSPQDPGTQDAQVTVSSSRQPLWPRQQTRPAYASRTRGSDAVFLSVPVTGPRIPSGVPGIIRDRSAADHGRRTLARSTVVLAASGPVGPPPGWKLSFSSVGGQVMSRSSPGPGTRSD